MIKRNNHRFFFLDRGFKGLFRNRFEKGFLFNHFRNKILRTVRGSRLGPSFLDGGGFGHGGRDEESGDKCDDEKNGDDNGDDYFNQNRISFVLKFHLFFFHFNQFD